MIAGGFERRIAESRPSRLLGTSLVLVLVGCFAALVGDAVARLLLASTGPAHLEPRREIAP